MKQRIKKLLNAFQITIQPAFTRISFLSRLYFLLFDQAYGFEQQSVLKGKVGYRKGAGIQAASSSLLRRNIHRLEKGLIMRPRRSIFALDYIGETLTVFDSARKIDGFSEKELIWASAVLSEYFSVIDTSHAALKAHFDFFESLNITNKHEAIPYISQDRAQHTVSYTQLNDLAKARRSTRWYQDKPVSRTLISDAVNIATQAPSACNRQSFRFICIDEKSLISKVAKLPGGTAGFSDNIPCLMAVVGDHSAYLEVRDRHAIYIDSSLASMQFMLACETLGLATCAINWPELKQLDKRVTSLLKLPQHERIIMFIAVGYALPEGGIAYSSKKTAEQLLTYLGDVK